MDAPHRLVGDEHLIANAAAGDGDGDALALIAIATLRLVERRQAMQAGRVGEVRALLEQRARAVRVADAQMRDGDQGERVTVAVGGGADEVGITGDAVGQRCSSGLTASRSPRLSAYIMTSGFMTCKK